MMSSGNKTDTPNHYDYIIIGAGLSALLLLLEFIRNPYTRNKKILVLESSFENYPPRTWCFWEKDNIKWDFLAKQKWQLAGLYHEDKALEVSLYPYSYKMVAAEDFREYAFDMINDSDNIRQIEATVLKIETGKVKTVYTKNNHYTAEYIFDSRFNLQLLKDYKGNKLYQQFKGKFVTADTDVFDDKRIRLMDFRMEQNAAVAFCYVLPINNRTALIEYTLFTGTIQEWHSLEKGTNDYIRKFYPEISFQTVNEEQGIIPMTDYKFRSGDAGVVPIGTAGGCSKASSGYTFYFCQKHAKAIVNALEQNKTPQPWYHLTPKRFHFYDQVLLNILTKYPEKGAGIFFRLFNRNKASDVLDFLNNNSSLRQEVKMFSRLPVWLFLKSALKVLFLNKKY